MLLSCDGRNNNNEGENEQVQIYVPEGFQVVQVVDSIKGKARHIAVRSNGDVYVKLRHPHDAGGNAVLRDQDGDGKADTIVYFGDYPYYGGYGTGMRIYENYLYYSSQTTVYRQKLIAGQLLPEPKIEIVVQENQGKRPSREHIAKPMAFDEDGYIYVPFGAPSNACQNPKRTPGAPGQDPCPDLEHFGGVWRFEAHKLNQYQDDGVKWATGIRSLVTLEWNKKDGNLYTVMHGRDDLMRLFADIYDPWESAMLPSEEFLRIEKGKDFGWPYCYYDQMQNKKVLAPEYGGDGYEVGRCKDCDDPLFGFPGHWAPNDMLFYDGEQFPERYKSGAFVAFHGSTNRAPYPQAGYFIGFVPFENGNPTGSVEIFADGFAGIDTIINVSDAIYRPMGLAQGPSGELYIGETEKGAIWKVEFVGDRDTFGLSELLAMERRKQLPHYKTPDKERDILTIERSGAEMLYYTYCSACHQENGRGDKARFPPLARTDWVTGDKERLISILLEGMEGEITVNDRIYNNVMPKHDFLDDAQIAEVLTYIRQNFGNNASSVNPDEVAKVRMALSATLN